MTDIFGEVALRDGATGGGVELLEPTGGFARIRLANPHTSRHPVTLLTCGSIIRRTPSRAQIPSQQHDKTKMPAEADIFAFMEPTGGFEPPTPSLRGRGLGGLSSSLELSHVPQNTS